MGLLLEGIGWGLFLSILVGPIVFALIQTGIEKGFQSGMVVGLGIWISDLLFITLTYYGINYVRKVAEVDGFKFWLGSIGGLVLLVVGIYTYFTRPEIPSQSLIKRSTSSYLKLFLKGFFINTLNPFTVFFWLTITGTVIIERSLDWYGSFLFYSGLLGTIIISDSAKVFLAKSIRPKLNASNLMWVRRIAGVALAVCGVLLMIRVWIF